MIKEQAAEKYATDIATSDRNVYRKAEKDFIAGWEAHEALSPTDAVAKANKIAAIIERIYKIHNPGPHFDYAGFGVECVIELLSLFNPPTEGPVMVKASQQKPEIRKEKFINWMDGKWHKTTGWLHEDGYWVTPFGTTKDHDKIEWLDFAAPVQQVFTREQIEDALFVGRGFGQLETTEMSIVKCREYMNANYPIQK